MKAIIYDARSLGDHYDVLDIPEDYLKEASRQREFLIERLAEQDDFLMEKFVDGQEVSESELKRTLRRLHSDWKESRCFAVQPFVTRVFNHFSMRSLITCPRP
jgi:elongation factor G